MAESGEPEAPKAILEDGNVAANEVLFSAPECPVEKVTVYPDRAEVCRRVETDLVPGLNQVVLKQLPDMVDPDSIRVEGKGNATITEVVFHSESVPRGEGDLSAKEKELTQEGEELGRQEKDLQSELSVLKKQWQLLDKFANTAANAGTGGKEEEEKKSSGAVQLDESFFKGLTDFLDLYSREGNSLEKKQIELTRRLETITEKLNANKENLNKVRRDKGATDEIKQCMIVVDCKDSSKVCLLVSYVTSNASWKPSYDIRMYTSEDMLKITYYGQIRQSTGEDWTDAKLFLSTAMPSIGGEVPELFTAELKLRKPRSASAPRLKRKGFGIGGFSKAAPTVSFQEDGDYLMCEAESMAFKAAPAPLMPAMAQAETEVGEGVATTMYEIVRRSTIPSDNVEHKVTVGLVDIKPKISYTSVPQRVPHAFMLAKLTNSSPFTFLAGETNIFLDNTFVGKASIKDVYPLEEFDCSLGVDPAVKVTYKPLKKYRASSGLLGKTISNTNEQVIEIKNTHDYDIQILVSDQLPRSADDRVKVHLQEPALDLKHPEKSKDKDVVLNKNNNLEWSLELKKQESRELTLKYITEHPHNFNIVTSERLENIV